MSKTIDVRLGSYLVQGVPLPDPDTVFLEACALWCDDAPLDKRYVIAPDGRAKFTDNRVQSLYEATIKRETSLILRANGID